MNEMKVLAIATAVGVGCGFGGFLWGMGMVHEEQKQTYDQIRAFRTPAKHDQHNNYTVIDKQRRLIACTDCGVVFCAIEQGLVADWSKLEERKPLSWLDYH